MVQFVTALLEHQAAAGNSTARSQLQMMGPKWRLAHREAVFSYLGELNEPPTFTAGRPLDGIGDDPKDICWVELTATGSRPTVPEALFYDDDRQLFLSAFLLRKRDGRCATLFQHERCDYSEYGDDVPLSGELWDCDVASVFCLDGPLPYGPLPRGLMTATVYSGKGCTCPNKPTQWYYDSSEEVRAAYAAFHEAGGCTCELGKRRKLCGLSIEMYDIEFDDDTREDDKQPTMSDLLRKLESPSCADRWA